MLRRIAPLACSILLCTPATALVGGAPIADENAARAVVMIVGSRGSFCTGTAIARDLVLTAAHCVLPGSEYKLVAFDGSRQPAFRDISRVARHPQFNLQTMLAHRATADTALLKLALPQPATAKIGAPRDRVAAGDRFTVVGYGVSARGDGATTGTARTAELVATGKPGNLQLRLMDPATQGKSAGLGACTGDSGAPVFDTRDGLRTIIGVVSWATGPNGSGGCGGLTGVTPLELYRNWILETARELSGAMP
jgi:secreted trypsin-like serine protease